MTPEYRQQFLQSYLTFLFQRVYCPFKEKLVHLSDPDTHPEGYLLKENWPDPSKRDFLGAEYSPEVARKIARGQMNPISMKMFEELPSKKQQ